MDISDDQHDAETKRTIALYVGGIGSIVWGVVFLLFMSFLIERDNRIKLKKKADDLRRQSALIKKRQEEQKLDKATTACKPSESSDSETEESHTTSSTEQKIDPDLNGFFRRSSIVAVIIPLNESQANNSDTKLESSHGGSSSTAQVQEIYEPVEILRSSKGEAVDFKENLTAALQLHVQKQNTTPSPQRISVFEGIVNLGVDSEDSSVSNSRRTSTMDSPAYPLASCISSQGNSRRPSSVAPEPIRSLPEYESLKFVPGVTGAADDWNDLPRYGVVIARSRRGSIDNQYGQGSSELSKTESSTDPEYQNDFLPTIPESPHSTIKNL